MSPTDEVAAPGVVAIVVAHDPGAWFDDALASLALQRYGNLAVLVVDTASDEPVAPRVAAVLPDAQVLRLDDDPGFGPAVNRAARAVVGAAFLLVCHDDVVLDERAVQSLVEEAYRSNAGVVGPKLVDWDRSDVLLDVGLGVDKFGDPSHVVEPGELDQEQHDAVRDVFAVPGAVTLVRADLFDAVGGFDEAMDVVGEDVDLCWRAQVAGARVVVAPDARVTHRRSLHDRAGIPVARRDQVVLERRHRLRTVFTNYGPFHRWRVLPQAAVVTLVESLVSLVLGRVHAARAAVGAWPWNLRRLGTARSRRRVLAEHRVAPDREVRRLQVRGSARLAAAVRRRTGANDDRIVELAGTGRGRRAATSRASVAAWVVVGGLVAFGTRDLLTGPLPAVGELGPLTASPADLLGQWTSGWNGSGLGSAAPAPAGYGLLAVLGTVFLGFLGLLRRVLVLGALPLGLVGTWRLTRPLASRRSRVVALVAYAANPVAYNALAQGRWGALVAYGLAPWLVNQLARASRLAPFGDLGDDAGPGVWPRSTVHRAVVLGALSALGAMIDPVLALLAPAIALALAVGGVLVGQVGGALRMVAAGFGSLLVVAVLLGPWALAFATPQVADVLGVSTVALPPLTTGEVLAFATGPAVSSLLVALVVPAALLGLLVGRRWRLGWAARGWALALGGWAAVWVGAQGWAGGMLPPAEVLLAPAAVGLALACAMGTAAFEVDVPAYRFGWPQLASVLAAGAFVVAAAPTVVASADGAWSMPAGDGTQTLSLLPGEEGTFRVLWIGDGSVMPLAGWPLDVAPLASDEPGEVLVYATADARVPTMTDQWVPEPGTATPAIADALGAAASGGTARLGELLAPMGVLYVVVPTRLAPTPYVAEDQARPQAVLDLLDAQLDLDAVDLPAGLVVYRNASWGPTRALLPQDTAFPPADAPADARRVPALAGAPAVLGDAEGATGSSGAVPDSGVVWHAEGSDERWSLSVDGQPQAQRTELGWADAYTLASGGDATLSYATPPWVPLWTAGTALAWALLALYLVRTRARAERRRADADAAAPSAAGSRRPAVLEGSSPATAGGAP